MIDCFNWQGAIGTNVTVDTVCGIMTDESNGSPIERYAKVNSLMLATYSQKCLDNSYNKMIKGLQATAWNASASEGGKRRFQGNLSILKQILNQWFFFIIYVYIYVKGT